MIYIGKPYLEKNEDKTRLCATVNYDGKDETIWYEVDNEYADCLCYERADAFLVAFLPYAMAFKHDIKIDSEISERLYYQLKNYYIPSLGKFTEMYNHINIEHKGLSSEDYSSTGRRGVATGFSAGVDSFYSVLKHLDSNTKSYNLTHLTFFKVGATGSFGGEKADQAFVERTKEFQNFADKVGLPFVIVNSNVSEHARMSYNKIHTFRSMSAVLAVQKLFKTYYYSSTGTIKDFSFDTVDVANFDFFNLNNFSVEGMEMYSVGLDSERLEKQDFISKFDITYDYLNVCNKEAFNCCKCEKCIRTMAGFHTLGVLDKYSKVFDVEGYYKNLSSRLAVLEGRKHDGSAEGNIDKVLLKDMKKAGIKIPIAVKIKAIPYTTKAIAYKYARRIRPIRRWYHKKMSAELGCNYVD